MEFPKQIFEDIKGSDFEKHNKKQVTEDFVAQNFYECGWNIYRPLNDTGIDIITTKKVCQDNHTKFDEKTFNETHCKKCGKKLIEIHRFIQVKTRKLIDTKSKKNKDKFFGFTLKSKDFRNDPRHIFLLYSDATNEFIIIPMYEYLDFFYTNKEIGKTHFGTPSFRKGNNKMNTLIKDENGDWQWKGHSFMKFLNEKGMELLSYTKYDIYLDKFVSEITKMKLELFYNYLKGKKKQVDSQKEIEINELLENKRIYNSELIHEQREKNKENLRNTLSDDLKESINKGYLIKFKNLEL